MRATWRSFTSFWKNHLYPEAFIVVLGHVFNIFHVPELVRFRLLSLTREISHAAPSRALMTYASCRRNKSWLAGKPNHEIYFCDHSIIYSQYYLLSITLDIVLSLGLRILKIIIVQYIINNRSLINLHLRRYVTLVWEVFKKVGRGPWVFILFYLRSKTIIFPLKLFILELVILWIYN